jgi:electron transport complex protein RnfG
MTGKGYIGEAWLVLILSTCFGGSLAVVHIAWQGRIDQNKRNETYDQIPRLVVGADKELTEELVIDGRKVLKAFGKGPDGQAAHLGWVVRASGQGFADRIELLIGLNARGDAITGLYVLEQKETPGLGSKITGDFQEQFAGKDPAKPLEVTNDKPAEGANQIRAIAGATVSTRSVCDIVNVALKGLPGKLAAGAKE